MEYSSGGYLRQAGTAVPRDHDPPVTWDAEEDHLLSYFLDESSSNNDSTQRPIQTKSASHQHHYSNLCQENPPVSSSSGTSIPSTPAVQFYAPNTSNHHSSSVPRAIPLDSSSSSSSSLSSMAATLVSSNNIIQHQHHLQHGKNPFLPQVETSSAAVSTANIGPQQDMMMLPPPRRQNADGERQHHIAWLSHVNPQAQNIAPSMFGPLAPNPIISLNPTYTRQESKERRARRLARNRESARQSRRRKKERLTNLSGRVNQLYSSLDKERRRLLNELEPKLQELRQKRIQELSFAINDNHRLELAGDIMNRLGGNCTIRKDTISFQYAVLKQLMLPKHQIFILWLTLQEERFFSAGKHERAKIEGVNNRVSSKQIGEELTNKWNTDRGKARDRSSMDISDEVSPFTTLTSRADEPSRLWPLFSFDMSISVDQEERLLHFHKLAKEMPSLANDRCEMSASTKLIANMKRGLSSLSQSACGRSQQLLLDILEPEQSAKFLNWHQINSNRIRESLPTESPPLLAKTTANKEGFINEVCKQMEETLSLPEAEDSPEDRKIMKIENFFW